MIGNHSLLKILLQYMEEFQEKYGGGIASQDVRSDARKVEN